jgi:hypothetical protein
MKVSWPPTMLELGAWDLIRLASVFCRGGFTLGNQALSAPAEGKFDRKQHPSPTSFGFEAKSGFAIRETCSGPGPLS